MTDREQLDLMRHWNLELVRENSRLQEEVTRLTAERDSLVEANVNLRVERDAADVLLGAAIDEALGVRP